MTTHDDQDWAGLLQDAAKQDVNQPSGEGWKTFSQLAAMLPNIGFNKLHRHLREEFAKNRIEIYRGNEINEMGQKVNRVWYRIKPTVALRGTTGGKSLAVRRKDSKVPKACRRG